MGTLGSTPGRMRLAAASLMLAAILAVPSARSSAAQAPLIFVDEDTEVRKISFNFVESRTFEPEELQEQIAHTEPGFWDKLRNLLPLMEGKEHPFNPVELQRDVVRLRLLADVPLEEPVRQVGGYDEGDRQRRQHRHPVDLGLAAQLQAGGGRGALSQGVVPAREVLQLGRGPVLDQAREIEPDHADDLLGDLDAGPEGNLFSLFCRLFRDGRCACVCDSSA